MATIWKLLKLLLNNRFPSGIFKSVKNFLITIVKYIAIFGGIFFVLWFLLSRIVNYLSITVDVNVLALALILIFVVSLISSIANILNSMFMSKDNEILISLPVSFNQLFVAKLVYLYINEFIFNILYVGPMFVCVGVVGRLSAYYFLSFLLFFPILPFATLGVGSLLSIPIMFLVRFLKDHNKTTIIASLVAIAAIFTVYMFLITNISGAFNIAEKHLETTIEVNGKIRRIGGAIPVFNWMSSAFFFSASIWKMYVFLFGALVLLCAALPLIRGFYQKIAVFNNETKKVTKPKARKYVKRTPVKELFVNEFRTCLRSPSLIIQYFLFTLLTPLIVFAYDKLLFTIAVSQTGQSLIFASHVLVLMMLTTLSSAISSVAISRQGGLVYISKMIPISYEKQAFAKIAFNVLITWAAIVLATIVTCIFSTANIALVIISSIAAMFISIGHVCQSYDQDLRDPTIDWYDVSEVSTLSKNTTKTMLYGFLLSIILTLLTAVAKGNILATALVLIIPSALYAYGRLRIIRIRLKYLFDELEV